MKIASIREGFRCYVLFFSDWKKKMALTKEELKILRKGKFLFETCRGVFYYPPDVIPPSLIPKYSLVRENKDEAEFYHTILGARPPR